MFFFDIWQLHLWTQAYAKADRGAFAQTGPQDVAAWRIRNAKDHPAAMPGVD